MNICIFCHSILSDWNHGNAHFMRGIAAELTLRGHRVRFFENQDAWSIRNLLRDYGEPVIAEVKSVYPCLEVVRYDGCSPNLEEMLDQELETADLVLVHEWSPQELVRKIGEHRKRSGSYRLFFHDTHHRSITDPESMAAYDLSHYDGVLVFGEAIRAVYLARSWADHVWTWHEAADIRMFRPEGSDLTQGPPQLRQADLVWIGNWGDDERTEELNEFLIDPVRSLQLQACVYGVRYPAAARSRLQSASIHYGGWIPNYRVPNIMAHHRATVHIPRRPYAEALPGIPTIRVFEALACAIPLVSAWWSDSEGLFNPGQDYLVARNGAEMKKHLSEILSDHAFAASLARSGLQRILSRHTCKHRVDELLEIYRSNFV